MLFKQKGVPDRGKPSNLRTPKKMSETTHIFTKKILSRCIFATGGEVATTIIPAISKIGLNKGGVGPRGGVGREI